jgi:hypothetical protein
VKKEGKMYSEVPMQVQELFTETPVIKIGDKKDLYIESIDGSTVTYRRGTFKQGEI